VTDKELDDEIAKMADYYKATIDEVRESLEKNDGLENIRHNLRTRKTIEAIIEGAKITDGPWIDENAANSEKADRPKVAGKKKEPVKKSAKKG
jgi:hypothetical protein